MWFALNIVISVGLGVFAAWQFDIARVFSVLQPTVVCLSIMAAAVFVRLNRGMPTLDWKSLSTEERKNLTERIVDLTRQYMQIIGLNAVALIGIIVLSAAGATDVAALEPRYRQAISGSLIFVLSLCVLRMAYVVWRDYDIVKLQKELLDKAADRDAIEANKKAAEESLTNIKAANLRSNTITRAGA